MPKLSAVPNAPHKPDRIKPPELLKNLKREYVEQNQWVPIDDSKEGVVVLCLDPERVKSSRIVQNVFPKSKLIYRVTTQREFKETLNIFYGAEVVDTGDIGDLLSGLEDDEEAGGEGATDDLSQAADNELWKLVKKIVIDVYNQGASDIHIESY